VVGSQDTRRLKKSVGSVRSSMEKLDASLANVREIPRRSTVARAPSAAGNDDNWREIWKDHWVAHECSQRGGTQIEVQEHNEFLLGCTGVTGVR